MDKKKYQKPVCRSLGGFKGAEGACFFNGVTAYGTACSTGPENAEACGTGDTAAVHPTPLCNTSGTGAAQCVTSGITAYG